MIEKSILPYFLEFKFPFGLSHNTRKGTNVVYLRLKNGIHTGYGEAELPPYLPETVESVTTFLEDIILPSDLENTSIKLYMESISKIHDGNLAAKAALDMALYDLKSSITSKSIEFFLEINEVIDVPESTYTIGIGDISDLDEKLKNGENYSKIKLKIGSDDDVHLIKAYRKRSDKPFCVDVNQGWDSFEKSREMVDLLVKEGCFLIEQPFKKACFTEHKLLKDYVSIPVIADESFQTIKDLYNIKDCFDGINIKLAKCGGLSHAKEILTKAKKKNLKCLVGCMSGSSVAINAAKKLAPLCDWVDLDGPDLIKNDPDVEQLFANAMN